MLCNLRLGVSEFKYSIWILGILSCLFGTLDRSLALFSSSYLSLLEVFHLLAASCLLIGWLYLKPQQNNDHSKSVEKIQEIEPSQFTRRSASRDAIHLLAAETRMHALKKYHVIRQLHVLPFPFICQIYHLLNLKHLESVHSLSLSNLKVIDVSRLSPTALGGSVRFQTVLNSPFSILKLWRQPIVEVKLTLHSIYTVELSIPIYNGKRVIVMFNAFPLNKNQHEFIIDIYTDLNWPKPILKPLLNIASLVTLYEDLPYLQKLSEREWVGLINKSKTSIQNINCLFNRFVDLYASNLASISIGSDLNYQNFLPA